MRKIARWQGNTKTHDFEVEFYEDFKAEHFVAKIQTNSLTLLTPYAGSKPKYAGSKPKDRLCEELRENDLNQLYESTKQQIESRYAMIINNSKTIEE